MQPERRPVLEQLYRRYFGLVRWALRAAGVPEDSLDDQVHDVFVAVHTRLPERDRRLPLRQWIVGVARNVAFSQRRTTARRERRLAQLSAPEPPAAPDEVLARREAWGVLAEFLDELSPPQRDVFVMVEVIGMRVAELADVTGQPANTLHSRLKAARVRFGRRFDADACSPAERIRCAREAARPDREQRRRTWGLIVASVGGPKALLPVSAIALPGILTTTRVAIGAAVLLVGGVAVVATARPATSPRTVPISASELAPTRPRDGEVIAARPPPAADVSPPEPLQEPPDTTSSSTAPQPIRRRHSAKVPDRTQPPVAPVEPIAAEVAALERARNRLAHGDPSGALAVLDDFARPFATLDREHRRVERQAACAAGDDARARAASHALASMGARAADEPICPTN